MELKANPSPGGRRADAISNHFDGSQASGLAHQKYGQVDPSIRVHGLQLDD